MFCVKCGNKMEDGSLFCANCGTRVDSVVNAADVTPVDNAPAEVQPVNNVPAELNVENAVPAEVASVVNNVEPEVNQIPAGTDVNSQYYVQNDVAAAPKAKKKIKPGIIIAAAAVVVVLAVGAVFTVSASARNSVKKLFMSDEDYFRSVEKSALKDLFGAITDNYEEFEDVAEDLKSKGYETKLKASLETTNAAQDFLESFGKKELDVDLSWLKSASSEFTLKSSDKKYGFSGNLLINKETMADFDTIVDIDDGMVYFSFPILSDKYAEGELPLDLIASSIMGRSSKNMLNAVLNSKNSSVFDVITSEEIQKISDRYIDIYVDSLTKIKVSEDKVLKAQGVSVPCTKYTVTLTPKIQVELFKKLLKQLEKDEEVKSICAKLEKYAENLVDEGVISSRDGAEFSDLYDTFRDYISLGLDDLEDDGETLFDEFSYIAYVDSKGSVIGREFRTEDEDLGGYKYAVADGKYGFEIFFDYRSSQQDYRSKLVSKGTVNGGKLTGKFSSLFYDEAEFTIGFKDFDIQKLCKGVLDITIVQDAYELTKTREFKGYDLEFPLYYASKKFDLGVNLVQDSKNIISIKLAFSGSPSDAVKTPGSTFSISDEDDFEDFVGQLNFKKMLSNMKSANIPDEIYEAVENFADEPERFLKKMGFGKNSLVNDFIY